MTALSRAARALLLELSRSSIREGLAGGMLRVDHSEYAPELQVPRASFVTLHVEAELRGCIGSLEALRPLVVDVVENAYAAAFQDPRFPALTSSEFARLDIHLSILSVPEPMRFDSEQDLLAQLRPGVDGLILEESYRRGTFLPAVWDSLREPREFLRHLKMKAGLAPDYWSDRIKVRRYTAEFIP
jgi:AmmeMemoRadiSam system protein A